MSKIKWELTGSDPNDLKANVSEHDMLRVERMGKGNWWFAIYIGERDYMSGQDFPNVGSKEVAKQLCEGIYKLIKHIKP